MLATLPPICIMLGIETKAYKTKPKLKVVFLYFLLVRRLKKNYASVMELVDMTDSKSVAFGRGGSSPPTGTTFDNPSRLARVFLCLKFDINHFLLTVYGAAVLGKP